MVGVRGFEPPTLRSRTVRAKPDCATPRLMVCQKMFPTNIKDYLLYLYTINQMMLTIGAGNETRTRDFQLGKLTLYRLSYTR